jgi:hypothetical protein
MRRPRNVTLLRLNVNVPKFGTLHPQTVTAEFSLRNARCKFLNKRVTAEFSLENTYRLSASLFAAFGVTLRAASLLRGPRQRAPKRASDEGRAAIDAGSRKVSVTCLAIGPAVAAARPCGLAQQRPLFK